MATRINLDNGARLVAYNRCCECGCEWQDKPTGFARYLVCPRCGSKYWEWVSYECPGASPIAEAIASG